MEKHSCRVCGRNFPCGRSLGGHMRSHALHRSFKEDEAKLGGRYGLRDNPRKSRRFDDSRSFTSMISSFEMIGEEKDEFWSRGSYGEEMESESDSEATVISMSTRKLKRKRSRRIAAISDSSYSPVSSPEVEDGALCLMLLSKGASFFTDSSGKSSSSLEFGSNVLNKIHLFSSSNEELKMLEKSGGAGDHDQIIFQAFEFDNSGKRSRYECAICNKSFCSYQALGGHRSSHGKKNNQKYDSHLAGKSSEISQNHECSICGKIFASGQALGGHKRSHFVATSSSISPVTVGGGGGHDFSSFPVLIDIEQNESDLNSIDLNFPILNNEC